MSIKEDMQRAQTLIKAKRYGEARTLLNTIDHPKAREWLGKLDEIAPEPKAKVQPVKSKGKPKAEKKNSPLRNILYVIVLGMCGTLTFLAMLPQPGGQTSSSTPQGAAVAAVKDVYGSTTAGDVAATVTDTSVTVQFSLSNFSEGAARSQLDRLPRLLCEMRERGLGGRRVEVRGQIEVVDTLGNSSIVDGAVVTFDAATADAINCDNVGFVETQNIASSYRLHPALQR